MSAVSDLLEATADYTSASRTLFDHLAELFTVIEKLQLAVNDINNRLTQLEGGSGGVPSGPPLISPNAVSTITDTTAYMSAVVSGQMTSTIDAVIQWATLANIGTGPWTQVINGQATLGTIGVTVTGLTANTDYVVRYYLVDSANAYTPVAPVGENFFTTTNLGGGVPTGCDQSALLTTSRVINCMTQQNDGKFYLCQAGNSGGFNDPSSTGKNYIGATLCHANSPNGNGIPGATDTRHGRYLVPWWVASQEGSGSSGTNGAATTNLNSAVNAGVEVIPVAVKARIRSGYTSAGGWITLDPVTSGEVSTLALSADFNNTVGLPPNSVRNGTCGVVFRLPGPSDNYALHGGTTHASNPGNGWAVDVNSLTAGNANWALGSGSGSDTADVESKVDCIVWGYHARLVVYDSNLSNDLANARYLFQSGMDPYVIMPTQEVGYYTAVASSRLVRLTTSWQFIAAATFTDAGDAYFNGDNTLAGITSSTFTSSHPSDYT